MSEYWKSTPKYWCKHCQVYVRDTKLERNNHEATGKHQGALKRFLRDLHRGHEKEEKDKERVKREIERLNGVVGSSSGAGGSSSAAARAAPKAPASGQEPQRQKQWEQLAEMGIDIPTELRRDMALAGDWQVTKTRIVDDTPKTDENGNAKVEAIATGVRKRIRPEGEEELEEALKGLSKKPKKWGRDSRQAPEDDAELEALLSGALPVKKEKVEDIGDGTVKKEEESLPVKKELSEDNQGIPDTIKPEVADGDTAALNVGEISEAGVGLPVVVFKKRMPKKTRQK
ncbi:hypothetical protein BJ170DRAFT_590825 [Xylariales sp. AK1849]|nr:hypothetical protein BJ170DRAFT_590825 [Xylariales sp. AK1849]